MARPDPFAVAVAHTLGIEGGYADDPSDLGGKTNWGITEAVARANGYTGDMRVLPKARALLIYRRLYWDALNLDEIAVIYPQAAIELFDTAVNMGISVAGAFLQRTLNALNRQGRDYPDLLVDGRPGPVTASALRALLRQRGAGAGNVVVKYLDALQGARYIELAEARPLNEDFVYGWAKRVGE